MVKYFKSILRGMGATFSVSKEWVGSDLCFKMVTQDLVDLTKGVKVNVVNRPKAYCCLMVIMV